MDSSWQPLPGCGSSQTLQCAGIGGAATTVAITMRTIAEVPTSDEWLTPWEAEAARTLRFPKRRADWRLGRWTAKQAVREWLRLSDDDPVEIRPRADGAPFARLESGDAPCAISLSHSNGIALCAAAAAGVAIGCDIELIETRDPGFADDYFTPHERGFLERLPQESRDAAVTLIWSAKESALKAIGEGLRLDTRTVEVATEFLTATGSHAEWQHLAVRGPGGHREYRGWWIADAGFVVTVVVDGAKQNRSR